MGVSFGAWVITCLAIVLVFAIDFVNNARNPHEPTFKEAARWSVFYVVLAVLFGLFVWWRWGSDYGGQFFAGFITEKALSVDNLFVFTLIMTSFAVPRKYQAKLLLLGIVIALVMRVIFIAAGAAVIGAFSWSFYIFGLVLILTAVKLANPKGHNTTPDKQSYRRMTAAVRRFVPVTDEYDDDKFVTTVDGERAVTPMTLALIALALAAGLFGLDSILAIYGLTDETFIVLTANAFAMMGLRELYFLIGGLLDRLVYLTVGLALILGFLGVDLILHALKKNSLPFINNGNPVDVPEISTATAISVISAILVVTVVASLLRTRAVTAKDPAGQ